MNTQKNREELAFEALLADAAWRAIENLRLEDIPCDDSANDEAFRLVPTELLDALINGDLDSAQSGVGSIDEVDSTVAAEQCSALYRRTEGLDPDTAEKCEDLDNRVRDRIRRLDHDDRQEGT
jgi:hypothetical protein